MSELVSLEIEANLAILRLAPEGEKIPILTAERMKALREHLKALQKRSDLLALLIIGNSAGFCGGADISAIESVKTVEEGRSLAKEGQETFDLLESIPYFTVAAISGACAGGGCELALACKSRIALRMDSTRIGLPEVKLGILPGFGGTQRLPRLLGLPAAARVILKAQLLRAEEAKKLGLVDRLIDATTASDFLLAAKSYATQSRHQPHRIPLKDKFLSFTGLGRSLVEKRLREMVARESKGKYPAPVKAIEAMLCSLEAKSPSERKEAYAFEAKALGELIASPVCKSLVHIFHASEASQKLGRAMKENAVGIETAVVGAGVMGSGIAAVFLSRGYKVIVVDSSSQALARSKERIQESIRGNKRLSPNRQEELLKNLRFESDVSQLQSSAFVVEAIIEDFEGKRKLLNEICGAVSSTAIVASNTSSLSLTGLADGLPNPGRVIGMHFFNPAEKMPLVEIIRGEKTDERSLMLVAALSSAIGKYPVVVEDGAGFLVNRLLTPYLAEAGLLLSEGYSVQAIDSAALTFGMPMGPIRLLDEVGLDVAQHVSQIMLKAYGSNFAGPPHVEKLLKAGRKGKKTGSGFYLYQGGKEFQDGSLSSLLNLPATKTEGQEDISDRLMLRMVNEAVRCLITGVAGSPSKEAEQQIDLGTVMGCGFPPFLGGVLHYTRNRGITEVSTRLEQLSSKYGPRFKPVPEFSHHYLQSAPAM